MRQLRTWQAEALPIILRELDSRKVVKSTVGSGKSILIAEICRQRANEQILVTAPTVEKTKQLAKTIADWSSEPVGVVFDSRMDIQRITVVCMTETSLSRFFEAQVKPELWLAYEIHRNSDRLLPFIDILPGLRVGFTATPWRAEREKTISFFDSVTVDYTKADALRDGLLVRFELLESTAQEMINIDESCVKFIKEKGGQGLANAMTVDDAEGFAQILRSSGITASAIHYRLKDSEKSSILESFQACETQCLVYVEMLAEGQKMPWVKWLCARDPGRNSVQFHQEIERLMQPSEGKEHSTMFDPHRLCKRHGINHDYQLGGAQSESTGEYRPCSTSGINPESVDLLAEAPGAIGSYIENTHHCLNIQGLIAESKSCSIAALNEAWRLYNRRFRRKDNHAPMLMACTSVAILPHQKTVSRAMIKQLIEILTVIGTNPAVTIAYEPSTRMIQAVNQAIADDLSARIARRKG